MPDVIQRGLDALDHRQRGVEQRHEPDSPQHADLEIVDEAHHVRGDLRPARPERREHASHHRLDPVLRPERLQHGERDREQWHDREQGAVDESGRLEVELAVGQRPD